MLLNPLCLSFVLSSAGGRVSLTSTQGCQTGGWSITSVSFSWSQRYLKLKSSGPEPLIIINNQSFQVVSATHCGKSTSGLWFEKLACLLGRSETLNCSSTPAREWANGVRPSIDRWTATLIWNKCRLTENGPMDFHKWLSAGLPACGQLKLIYYVCTFLPVLHAALIHCVYIHQHIISTTVSRSGKNRPMQSSPCRHWVASPRFPLCQTL